MPIAPPTFHYEQDLRNKGYGLIAGIDEAGRGPLAGPVVAAAVILPLKDNHRWLNDIRESKQLAAERREFFYYRILESALAVGVGSVSSYVIDAKGIVTATKMAMRQAVQALQPTADFLLLDALNIDVKLPQQAIISGDLISISIAAASIIAKVSRDALMRGFDEVYPEYGFAQHKGYATPEHVSNLQTHGPCPIHRRSFAPVCEMIAQIAVGANRG